MTQGASRTSQIGDRVAAAVLLGVGAFVAVYARTLPYWHDYAPGPGFFPFWLGVLLACAAVVELAPTIVFRRPASERGGDPQLTRRSWALAALSVGAALLIAPLGLILATALFVAAASWTLDPSRRIVVVFATLLIPACVWLVFVAWLNVPLPRGPLGF
jgi:putative tricarboxylic transport membrane protein